MKCPNASRAVIAMVTVVMTATIILSLAALFIKMLAKGAELETNNFTSALLLQKHNKVRAKE